MIAYLMLGVYQSVSWHDFVTVKYPAHVRAQSACAQLGVVAFTVTQVRSRRGQKEEVIGSFPTE